MVKAVQQRKDYQQQFQKKKCISIKNYINIVIQAIAILIQLFMSLVVPIMNFLKLYC